MPRGRHAAVLAHPPCLLPSRRASASTPRSPRRCGWSSPRRTPRWPKASWWAPPTPARLSPPPYLSSSPGSPVSIGPGSPEGAPRGPPDLPPRQCQRVLGWQVPGVAPILVSPRENTLFGQFGAVQKSRVDVAMLAPRHAMLEGAGVLRRGVAMGNTRSKWKQQRPLAASAVARAGWWPRVPMGVPKSVCWRWRGPRGRRQPAWHGGWERDEPTVLLHRAGQLPSCGWGSWRRPRRCRAVSAPYPFLLLEEHFSRGRRFVVSLLRTGMSRVLSFVPADTRSPGVIKPLGDDEPSLASPSHAPSPTASLAAGRAPRSPTGRVRRWLCGSALAGSTGMPRFSGGRSAPAPACFGGRRKDQGCRKLARGVAGATARQSPLTLLLLFLQMSSQCLHFTPVALKCGGRTLCTQRS